jgi:archaellum biogenesis ATPase FlaH
MQFVELTSRFEEFFKKIYSLTKFPSIVYCLGFMNSGKTTLSLLFYYYFNKLTWKHTKLYYINALEHSTEDKTLIDAANEKLDSVLEKIKGSREYMHFIILDDFGFVIDKSAQAREFLYKIFRIRHITGKSRIIVWINAHYSKSLIPFFRSTPYRVLTSITVQEIKQLSSDYLFPVSDLWDYYYYMLEHPKRYIIYVNWWTISEIVDVTLDKNMKERIARMARKRNIEL